MKTKNRRVEKRELFNDNERNHETMDNFKDTKIRSDINKKAFASIKSHTNEKNFKVQVHVNIRKKVHSC